MMRVEQIIGRKAGKRLRQALPKTMDLIQSRVIERLGSQFDSMRSGLRNRTDAARKAARRGTEETVKWVRKNPAALPLLGVGGAAALTTLLMLRARSRARNSNFFQKAIRLARTVPQVRKGFGTALGRLISWTLTPRKPHVFRAISIRW